MARRRRGCCHVGERAVSAGLSNASGFVGKHLMFNYTGRALGVFEHELNEYKSVQVTRIVHDFYASDPKRGFYAAAVSMRASVRSRRAGRFVRPARDPHGAAPSRRA